VKNPRIFGSVLTGTDDEESDLGVAVHASTPENQSPKYRQRVIDEAEPLFRKKCEHRNINRWRVIEKIFFDEDVPRKLVRFLPQYDIQTVVTMQWAESKMACCFN